MTAVRALVIDDSPTMRSLLSRSLLALGYEVLQAAHGEEALAVLEQSGDRVPDLATVVLRGEQLPPPATENASDAAEGTPTPQQTPGDRPDDGERPASGPTRSAQVAAERENRAAQRADAEATNDSGPTSPEAGSGDDGGAAKVTP